MSEVLVLGDATSGTIDAIIKQLEQRKIPSERLIVAAAGGPDPLATAVRRSVADIKRAKDAYYRAEVIPAARLLGAIIASKATSLVLADRPELLGEAYYWLAVCRAKEGDEVGAKDAFAAAIHLGASGSDRARFSPRVRAIRDAVARSLADRSRQQRLTVTLEGQGAAVIRVDGKQLDGAGVTLAPGIHWLAVSAPGMSPHVERVRIKESPLAISVALRPATEAERRRQVASLGRALSGKDARRAALTLGALQGRRELLLVSEIRASGGWGLSLTRLRVPDGRVLGRSKQRGGVAQIEAMIRRSLLALWPLPVASASAPFYKRWWFWTAAGAAVIGGTLAAILATQASSSTRVTVVMDPPP